VIRVTCDVWEIGNRHISILALKERYIYNLRIYPEANRILKTR